MTFKLSNQYCSVPQCRFWAKRDPKTKLSFHRIPTENSGRVYVETRTGRELIDRRKVWISRLRIVEPVNQFWKICSLHFKAEDYFNKGQNPGRSHLKKTAVPSQNLPPTTWPTSKTQTSHSNWDEIYQKVQSIELHSDGSCGRSELYDNATEVNVQINSATRSLEKLKNMENAATRILPCIQFEEVKVKCEIDEDLLNEEGEIKEKCAMDEEVIMGEGIEIKLEMDEDNGEGEDTVVKFGGCDDIKTEEIEVKSEADSTLASHSSYQTAGLKAETPLYKCHLCNFETIDGDYLKTHYYVKHNQKLVQLYKCEHCPYETTYKCTFKRHLLTHKSPSEVQMYNCESCKYKTKYKNLLARHILKHKDKSEVQMYKCDVCLFETKHKNYLKFHSLIHKDLSEVELYKCGKCEFETMRKSYLCIHQLTHKDPSTLKYEDLSERQTHNCDECEFKTVHRKSLRNHKLTHKDPCDLQMYKCGVCEYQTKYKNHIKNHFLMRHGPTEVQMYRCDRCEFKTKYKSSLKNHKSTHKDNLKNKRKNVMGANITRSLKKL